MKKILGLDLGVTSIGWALISEDENGKNEIINLGSRIIPLSPDDKDEFSKGNAISKNQKRTLRRTQRKGYDRYQLRRAALTQRLKELNAYPTEELIKLSSLELYGLRDKAAKEKVSLKEFGRILYHLNQKRGYKSSRSDANLDKKVTEYVAEVKSRHERIKEGGLTVGQYFYRELKKDEFFTIKKKVFPHEAYIEEFNAITNEQAKYHPELTGEVVAELRDKIIYYQRRLKSQKGLVSVCEFEGFYTKNKKGKIVFIGPKVAPRSSPLFQVCKIWETVNNISLKNRKGEEYILPAEKKQEIFLHLEDNKQLTFAELLKILGLKKDSGWYGNKQLNKGLQGNLTKSVLKELLIGHEEFLNFDLSTLTSHQEAYLYDKKTGEILDSKSKLTVDVNFEHQPLYKLWHTIYSIDDLHECSTALQSRFSLPQELADKLSAIDFKKSGFGNKSARAIRKILPYLMNGYVYSEACSFAGYNHSNSFTKDEQLKKQLQTKIQNLQKNSLRQPIVEKILNQLINLVNAIIEKYGNPDEIRIELARQLKQSKEERNDAFISISANERLNDAVAERLRELSVRPTRKNIEKYKFIFPVRTVYGKSGAFQKKSFDEAQVVNQCIYCGESFSLSAALTGDNFDVDHIIPRSLLFDDSQLNKVLVHRKCNADDKKNKTAYDFIRQKGEKELVSYLERLDDWFKKGILSYAKWLRLKVSHEDYLERKAKKKETKADIKLWENFIDRQLRESQYIARKAKEILEEVSYNVWSTSGSVTEHLRRLWGWDNILMELQLPKYKTLGLTEIKEWESNGQKHQKEAIKDWSKRKDHRHHAIDALVVACTKQGFIQRLNTLNSQHTRDEMFRAVEGTNGKYKEKLSLLDKYLIEQKPFNTVQVADAASRILVSFKSGKRVATKSTYKAKGVNQAKGVIVPRGALSEESVYGKIHSIVRQPVKYLFENPQLIFKAKIKSLVEERLSKYNGNTKKAFSSLNKNPIYLDKYKEIELQFGTCYKEEVVIRKPVTSLNEKQVEQIVDPYVRERVKEHLNKNGGKAKEAFKNLEEEPIWFNEKKHIPIISVRCFTGLTAIEAVNKDESGKEISFVKPGNNHHIALYVDENGKIQEHACTFWHGVERKKHGIPVIIKNPKQVWEIILSAKNDYPESFAEKLPDHAWKYVGSLQQNEMLVLGLSNDDIHKALQEKNTTFMSEYLYRVQKIREGDYFFRHHLETEIDDSKISLEVKRFYRTQSTKAFLDLNPYKVFINNLGEVREYITDAIAIAENVKSAIEDAIRNVKDQADLKLPSATSQSAEPGIQPLLL